MFKTRTLSFVGGAFLSAVITPLALAQEDEPRGQVTENPLVPAAEATDNAYLGPRAGVDAGGLVDGVAWFIADIQTLEISWTIEYTGEADVTTAAIMCPEGEAAAPGDDPIGVSVEGMIEVIPIDASTEGALEGTSPNISEAVFTQIVNGECVLSLSTADVEHALTGRIL
jgi:hypothetical protein